MNQFSALSGLVYSTDSGRMCPDCRQPIAQCACKKGAPVPVADGPVRVQRETKGRGGKAVTVIRGVPLDSVALALLAKRLKTTCGSGGTAKDGTIEIQGDHRDKVVTALVAEGYAVKKTGG